ncbi:Scrasp1p [Mactra antiquata]
MKTLILSLCFVGCAFSTVIRDTEIPNVCLQAGGRIYFPHPTDNTKFLQCADGNRMFVITCPKGEIFDKEQTKCVSSQPATQAPMTNPCTPENIASGNIFFAYAGDKTKFIECDRNGQPAILSCPSRLIYDAGRQSCVLPAGSTVNGGTSTGTNTGTSTGTNTGTSTGTNTGTSTGTNTGSNTGTNTGTGTTLTENPCANAVPTSGNLFFPHPDPTKFIQCDLAGNAYVMQCPAGLVWSQNTSNCQSAFNMMTSGTNSLVG